MRSARQRRASPTGRRPTPPRFWPGSGSPRAPPSSAGLPPSRTRSVDQLGVRHRAWPRSTSGITSLDRGASLVRGGYLVRGIASLERVTTRRVGRGEGSRALVPRTGARYNRPPPVGQLPPPSCPQIRIQAIRMQASLACAGRRDHAAPANHQPAGAMRDRTAVRHGQPSTYGSHASPPVSQPMRTCGCDRARRRARAARGPASPSAQSSPTSVILERDRARASGGSRPARRPRGPSASTPSSRKRFPPRRSRGLETSAATAPRRTSSASSVSPRMRSIASTGRSLTPRGRFARTLARRPAGRPVPASDASSRGRSARASARPSPSACRPGGGTRRTRTSRSFVRCG